MSADCARANAVTRALTMGRSISAEPPPAGIQTPSDPAVVSQRRPIAPEVVMSVLDGTQSVSMQDPPTPLMDVIATI